LSYIEDPRCLKVKHSVDDAPQNCVKTIQVYISHEHFGDLGANKVKTNIKQVIFITEAESVYCAV
jgi:hypothetical protein